MGRTARLRGTSPPFARPGAPPSGRARVRNLAQGAPRRSQRPRLGAAGERAARRRARRRWRHAGGGGPARQSGTSSTARVARQTRPGIARGGSPQRLAAAPPCIRLKAEADAALSRRLFRPGGRRPGTGRSAPLARLSQPTPQAQRVNRGRRGGPGEKAAGGGVRGLIPACNTSAAPDRPGGTALPRAAPPRRQYAEGAERRRAPPRPAYRCG